MQSVHSVLCFTNSLQFPWKHNFKTHDEDVINSVEQIVQITTNAPESGDQDLNNY